MTKPENKTRSITVNPQVHALLITELRRRQNQDPLNSAKISMATLMDEIVLNHKFKK